jgi:DNA-binding transcriptional regulator YhcF (GntR family)
MSDVAKRVTDKQIKGIIADRVNGMSIRELARKYHVSTTTVQNVLKKDPELTRKFALKKEQNTIDMLAYLDSRTERAQTFVDKCLDELLKDGRLDMAKLSEITTALGTVIDKFTKNKQPPGYDTESSGLFAAIKRAAERK